MTSSIAKQYSSHSTKVSRSPPDQTTRKLLPALAFSISAASTVIAVIVRQADLQPPTYDGSMANEHQKSVIVLWETPMITRDAIMLAIALGASSAMVVATTQHDTALNLSYGVNGIDKNPNSNPDILKFSGRSAVSAAASAPIIVAQGRCFNRRCY